MGETRKLAAILAADVVGYSRLVWADEDRTLAGLRGLRDDLIDPSVAAHRGRIVKRTGDGSIMEFRSVIDAVRCAIEVQNGLVQRNSRVPDDRRIRLRIGLHVSDVLEESDGDLMGNGVNIAVRLERMAMPGAICLSEDAYRQVKGRLELKVSDLGTTQLKNIAEPIRVYSLEVGSPRLVSDTTTRLPTAPTRTSRIATAALALVMAIPAAGAYAWLSDEPRSDFAARLLALPPVEDRAADPICLSLVILPFENLSDNPEQNYLADSVTENLTTEVSCIRSSLVIARNAMTYKGKTSTPRRLASNLAFATYWKDPCIETQTECARHPAHPGTRTFGLNALRAIRTTFSPFRTTVV